MTCFSHLDESLKAILWSFVPETQCPAKISGLHLSFDLFKRHKNTAPVLGSWSHDKSWHEFPTVLILCQNSSITGITLRFYCLNISDLTDYCHRFGTSQSCQSSKMLKNRHKNHLFIVILWIFHKQSPNFRQTQVGYKSRDLGTKIQKKSMQKIWVSFISRLYILQPGLSGSRSRPDFRSGCFSQWQYLKLPGQAITPIRQAVSGHSDKPTGLEKCT